VQVGIGKSKTLAKTKATPANKLDAPHGLRASKNHAWLGEKLHAGKNQAITLEVLHDSQGLRDLGKGVRSFQQVFAFVRGANDGAQPGFSFGHGWIADGGREYAGVE
jgi:hypothetical protein